MAIRDPYNPSARNIPGNQYRRMEGMKTTTADQTTLTKQVLSGADLYCRKEPFGADLYCQRPPFGGDFYSDINSSVIYP